MSDRELETQYPGFRHAKELVLTGQFESNKLVFSSKSDLGNTIRAEILRQPMPEESDVNSEVLDWKNFKLRFHKYAGRKLFFRGQEKGWRLRTAFHRSGRTDLRRFRVEDVATLHRVLSARTKHYFDFQNADEVGAFWGLIQHHGYPTPILDWTYSPYVAAFFAFQEIDKHSPGDGNARIYVFDGDLWKSKFLQLHFMDASQLHFSIWPFPAIENERVVPQQAVSTGTNVDNLEWYIRQRETETRKSFLWAYDIPRSERNTVISELKYMGITAGTLFPGLDGACEELKEINFD